ncbi:formin-like protein 5 [Herpailurus yagouaroundi]|uniref:formin-like protein 5 n=1 Tax=Herpailurus yagouaroundi TaxID=1608482 RepID=UPI001AD6D99E|nr:formin-like protein 5 [Puma yagouaroundi]
MLWVLLILPFFHAVSHLEIVHYVFPCGISLISDQLLNTQPVCRPGFQFTARFHDFCKEGCKDVHGDPEHGQKGKARRALRVLREIYLRSPGAEGGDEPPPRPRRFRFKGRCPSGRAGRSRKTRAACPLRRVLGPPHAVPGSRRRVPRPRDPLSPARPFRSGLPDPGRLTPALLAPLPLFLQPDRRPSAHPSRCRRPDPRALNVGSLHPPPPPPPATSRPQPPSHPGTRGLGLRRSAPPTVPALNPLTRVYLPAPPPPLPPGSQHPRSAPRPSPPPPRSPSSLWPSAGARPATWSGVAPPARPPRRRSRPRSGPGLASGSAPPALAVGAVLKAPEGAGGLGP